MDWLTGSTSTIGTDISNKDNSAIGGQLTGGTGNRDNGNQQLTGTSKTATNGNGTRKIGVYASGGVVPKGQTAFLEGNGTEAVVPLENNKKWISKVAADMSASLGSTNSTETQDALLDVLKDIRDEIKKQNNNMYDTVVDAISNGVKVKVNDREIMRMVKTYA